jgi:hypothetical protein
MDNGCCTYRKCCGGRVWGPFRGWPCLGGSSGISCVAWKAGGTCHRWGQSLGALVWRWPSPHPGPTAVSQDIVGRAWGTPSSKEEVQEVSQPCLKHHGQYHTISGSIQQNRNFLHRFVLILQITCISFITSICPILVDNLPTFYTFRIFHLKQKHSFSAFTLGIKDVCKWHNVVTIHNTCPPIIEI